MSESGTSRFSGKFENLTQLKIFPLSSFSTGSVTIHLRRFICLTYLILHQRMSTMSSSGPSSSTVAVPDKEPIKRSRILSSKLYFDVPLSKVGSIYFSSNNCITNRLIITWLLSFVFLFFLLHHVAITWSLSFLFPGITLPI